MNYIFTLIWLIVFSISIYYMVIRFKVNHYDNKHITHQDWGGVFQVFALCQFSFTYQVLMRNDPPHQKYMDKYFHPVHATVMYLDK